MALHSPGDPSDDGAEREDAARHDPRREAFVHADRSEAKREMRRRTLSARDALPREERARLSVAACARAEALPEISQARALMLFAAFRTEIDTGPLIAWALGAGKLVCLPRVLGPRQMAAFRVIDPRTDLVPGSWGIPEPRDGLATMEPGSLDAVVVPGAAFDVHGRRCGYGGGFYDTFLPLTRPGVPRIALAFETQIVPELPCEPHDLAVDVIVTESRVLRTT